MSLSLATRRARLLAVRAQIDASGGGSLLLCNGTMVDSPEVPLPGAPLASVALAEVSFALHATAAEMSLVPTQGFVQVAGQATWARYVDGAGTPVYDCTAGPPGSGAELIVTDNKVPPSAQFYVGGEINLTHTISEA